MATKRKIMEIIDPEIDEVSLVDKGANGEKFLIIKNVDGSLFTEGGIGVAEDTTVAEAAALCAQATSKLAGLAAGTRQAVSKPAEPPKPIEPPKVAEPPKADPGAEVVAQVATLKTENEALKQKVQALEADKTKLDATNKELKADCDKLTEAVNAIEV